MDLFIPDRPEIAPTATDDLRTDPDVRSIPLEDVPPDQQACLVVVGRPGVHAAVAAGCPVPVLVVDGPPGIPSVERDHLDAALETVRAADHARHSMPIIQLDTPDGTVPVAFDAKLMTEAPAAISEFAITCGEEAVAQYRADGVVLATPMGSSGYARAGGGTVCSPTLDGISVVPIAPYRTNPRHWLLDGDVGVRIARDEELVTVIVDDEAVTTLGEDDAIVARLDGRLICCDVPAGRSAFADA